jgi:ATP-dependent Lon protease
MDRIKEIDVKPFKLDDKKHIVKQFIINEMCEQVNFEKDSVIIKDEDIEFIIDKYTYEPGVRDIKRKIEKLFLKLNIDRIYKENIFKKAIKPTKDNPITLDKNTIEKYLGKHNMDIQYVHEEDQVGVINGLFATDSGYGGILPIQVYNNYTGGDDKFALKLTGSQRRVMRESVISAFTTAINIVNDDKRNEYIEQNPGGYHIHCTNTATPKDGPSAGSAFATAFVSRLLNKKIKHNIAMTGEIELTGRVTKIGGLQYKLTGAKKAGVKLVLVSKENKEDLENIKKEYKDLFEDDFNVILVDDLREILEHVLVDFDKNDLN